MDHAQTVPYDVARRHPGVPLTQLRDAKRDAAARRNTTVAERDRQIHAAAANHAPCPRCDAPAGQPCRNLRERARGNEKPTKRAHDERLALLEGDVPPQTRAHVDALTTQLDQANTAVAIADTHLTFAYAVLRTRGAHPNLKVGHDKTLPPATLRTFQRDADAWAETARPGA